MIEYPRWIYSSNGESKVVMTEDARNALKGDWYDTPTLRDMATLSKSLPPAIEIPKAVDTVEYEEDEKSRLYVIAEKQGIKIDKRWGLEKLSSIVGG